MLFRFNDLINCNESSHNDYALLQQSGKQIRRSLKTKEALRYF